MKFTKKIKAIQKPKVTKKPIIKKKDTPVKDAEFKSFKRGMFDWRYYKQWYVKKNTPSTQLFIQMELRTGKWDFFFIDIGKGSSFNYLGGEYIIDSDLKSYVTSLNLFSLRYHQDLCTPIKQIIPVKEINEAITSSGTLDIENATNPITLRNFVVSDVIKDVIQSGGIHTCLKTMQLLMIIAVIVGVLHFFVYVMKSGILKEITGALGV